MRETRTSGRDAALLCRCVAHLMWFVFEVTSVQKNFFPFWNWLAPADASILFEDSLLPVLCGDS